MTVARRLGWRGATIVNVQNSMLFTPMLPEVAGGVIEMRNVMTPLAMACPHAEIIPGRVTDLALEDRCAEVETDGGVRMHIEYEHVVVAVGAVPRTLPIAGLTDNAVGCSTVLDALYLRNQLLRMLAAAEMEPDLERRRRHLTFVFVGAGFAGVEALAELHNLAQDALRYHPTLRDVRQRWILVDAAPTILGQIPSRLGQYVHDRLVQRGVELRLGTRLVSVVDGRVALSDGTECDAGMLVWAAGIRANPIVARFGLPLDERGRVRVRSTLQVVGYEDVWALGDCAAVPNPATQGRIDPPTSQHALRQGQRLGKNLIAAQEGLGLDPYNFRSLGQVATLGRREGIADLRGLHLKGLSGWLAARAVHVMQVPRVSQRIGVLGNWIASLLFRGSLVTVAGLVDAPSLSTGSTSPVASPVRLPAPSSPVPKIEERAYRNE
ncbi:MAG: FAD-dependent oxidoreductase [Acidimicrobiaceae bacterium]|nr:FAD-dependent oxidoreductase [Acidimicrobiaceae bacterium]